MTTIGRTLSSMLSDSAGFNVRGQAVNGSKDSKAVFNFNVSGSNSGLTLERVQSFVPTEPDGEPEYLANDKKYQEYKGIVDEIDAAMKVYEDQYDVTRGDQSSQLNIALYGDEDAMTDYIKLSVLYSTYAPMLDEYRAEMAEWKDGPIGERSYFNRNGREYNNLERITLKDGQRAWRSDQGVFYPYIDGKIGNKTVPAELVP